MDEEICSTVVEKDRVEEVKIALVVFSCKRKRNHEANGLK